MRSLQLLFVLLAVFTIFGVFSCVESKQLEIQEAPQNHETGCLVCVSAVLVIERNLDAEAKNIAKVLSKACDFLPSSMTKTCSNMLRFFGPQIVRDLIQKIPVDDICSKLNLCHECKLSDDPEVQYQGRLISAIIDAQFNPDPKLRYPLRYESSNRNIVTDFDGDSFSEFHRVPRGADWKGKDCDDYSVNHRPGIYDYRSQPEKDFNCNGIYGRDEHFQSYEHEFCDNSDVRSFVTFGDSVGAAFNLPPEWIYFKNLSVAIQGLENELDWPHLSASSGWDPSVEGSSLYSLLRANNLCNHRDYQNVAKNGAVMNDLATNQIHKWSVPDKPVFAYIGYVGNDVCKNSLDKMTKPEDFRQQFIDGLDALNNRVRAPSFVIAFGLVDGRILWDTMHKETHPLGVSYETFYRFLSCTGNNPCHTWLNSDESIRNATSIRAAELSREMADVAANVHFDNLSVFYVDFVEILHEVIDEFKSQGKPLSLLISPFDGFHPSIYYGHRFIAKKIWDRVQKFHPEFIGKPNPFNKEIEATFGDQGGF